MIISFINIGYGDAILIEHELPDGGRYNILVDGGKPGLEHYREFSQRIRAIDYLNKKGIEKINLMVITHLHEDHVGGLMEVAANIEVGEVWSSYVLPVQYIGEKITVDAGYQSSTANHINSLNLYSEICLILKKKGTVIREINGIERNVQISEGLAVDIFGAEYEYAEMQKDLIDSIFGGKDADMVEKAILGLRLRKILNKTSIALRLLFGNTRILLCGDTYSDYWDSIMDRGIPIGADILKLSHHGRPDGTSERFAKAVGASYVVVSTSNNQPDKGPDPKVIEFFEKASEARGKAVRILFTDAVHMPPYSTFESRHNAIEFSLQGDDDIKYVFINEDVMK